MNRERSPPEGPPPVHATARHVASGNRGQTSIDFAIAMGVFLVAMTTVIAFMPSIIQPFTGSQQNPLVADRLAMQITNDQLTETHGSAVLNGTCTLYFFNSTGTDPCETFDATDDITDKLGLDDTVFVNVTLQSNVSDHNSGQTEVLCGDGNGNIVGYQDADDSSSCGGGTPLATGPEPPTGGGSITSARRNALLVRDDIWQITVDRKTVYIVVRVWT